MESRKITIKNLAFSSRQIIQDLRALQKTGLTLPDIIYNYSIQGGHTVRKRHRKGSISGDEEEQTQEQKDKTRDDFLRAGRLARERGRNHDAGNRGGHAEAKIHRKSVPVRPMRSDEAKMEAMALPQGGATSGHFDGTTEAKASRPRKNVGFGGAGVIPSDNFETVDSVGSPREKKAIL